MSNVYGGRHVRRSSALAFRGRLILAGAVGLVALVAMLSWIAAPAGAAVAPLATAPAAAPVPDRLTTQLANCNDDAAAVAGAGLDVRAWAANCQTAARAAIAAWVKTHPAPTSSPTASPSPTATVTPTPTHTVGPTTAPPTTPVPTTTAPPTTPPASGTSFATGPAGGVGPATAPTKSISSALQSSMIYDGYAISGNAQVSANNITLKNCTFTGGPIFSGNNVTIDHCAFTGGVSFSGSQFVTFTANSIVTWNGDGLHITSDSGPASDYVITGNWVHLPGLHAPQDCALHSDALQILGLARATFSSNVFDSGHWISCGSDPGDGPLNGTQMSTEQGSNDLITYDGNWFNGGGILVRVYGAGSTNVHVTNNRFGPDFQFSAGDTTTAGAGFIWSGNVDDASNAPVMRT